MFFFPIRLIAIQHRFQTPQPQSYLILNIKYLMNHVDKAALLDVCEHSSMIDGFYKNSSWLSYVY